MTGSIRNILAQSIFPRLECARFLTDREYSEGIEELVQSGSAGGFVAFAGSVDQAAAAVARLQEIAEGTLLFAADCEDGVTMRFTGGTEFPSMMALGAADDTSTTYAVSQCIAREMRSIGIYWNFAPVADINTNPDNPIINIRSFGSKPEAALRNVRAYIRGTQDTGVAACAKHFPGHGDTAKDSHTELPVLPFSRDRILSTELVPFIGAISQNVRSVMPGHIAVPALDPLGSPASLSGPIITGLLRNELEYNGVIVTDAMDMGAITKLYTPAEAALKAYLAGNDVLETMPDPGAALEALVMGFETGIISKERASRTAGRIMDLKQWSGQFPGITVTRQTIDHRVISLEAARRSRTTRGTLPKISDPLMLVCMSDTDENPKPGEWLEYAAAVFPQATAVIVPPDPSDERAAVITADVEMAGSVVLGLFVKPRGSAGTIGLSAVQERIVGRIFRKSGVILINFGNPYLLQSADPVLRIDMYSASSASLAVSLEQLGSYAGECD